MMMMMKSFAPLLLASVALMSSTSCQAQQQQQQQQLVRNGRDGAGCGRRSLLPCLGIFKDCSDITTGTTDTTTGSSSTSNSTDSSGSGSGGGLLGGNLCLGIFRNCSETANSTTTTSGGGGGGGNTNCSESTDGAFGGRPLFGECGIVGQVLGQIFNGTYNDANGDGIPDGFNGTADFNTSSGGNGTGPFGLGLLPEGGLLWQVFYRPEDQSILAALTEAFNQNTQSFTDGFLQDWSESATVSSNATCNNATSNNATSTTTEPACLDAFGNEGFWICRTLTNPFTGNASSRSVCINQGGFLENNDQCGCCGGGGDATNTTTTVAPTCPAPCPCGCFSATGSGVLITTNINDAGPIVSDLFSNNATNATTTIADGAVSCVDPRLAVSLTSRVNGITCVTTCPV